MKIPRSALLISLCLHLIFLIAMAISLHRKIMPYADVGEIITDLIKIPAPRSLSISPLTPKSPEFSSRPAKELEKERRSLVYSNSATDIQTPNREQPLTLSVISRESFQRDPKTFESEINLNPASTFQNLVRPSDLASTPARNDLERVGSAPSGSKIDKHKLNRSNSSLLDPASTSIFGSMSDVDLDRVDQKNDSSQVIPDLGKPLKLIAQHIVSQSQRSRVDVVFAIDYSGSMGDNINAVNEHLTKMLDIYEAANFDAALGLIQFHTPDKGRDEVKVLDLTKNLGKFRTALSSMFIKGDEHALDAIMIGMNQIKFRPDSDKHLILMTDEPFTGTADFQTAVRACNEFWVSVNVLGIDEPQHRDLAEFTGGIWEQIPQSRQGGIQNTYSLGNSRNYPWKMARNATWSGMKDIIDHILELSASYTKLDLIVLVDTSRSMEDKAEGLSESLKHLLQALEAQGSDFWVGAARFRSSNAMNYVNVYHPPQTIEQLEKILQIPYQDDEDPLEAVVETLRRVKFRPAAKRVMLLITDEPLKNENQMYSIIASCQREAVELNILGAIDDKQKLMANMTGGVWALIPDSKKSDIRW